MQILVIFSITISHLLLSVGGTVKTSLEYSSVIDAGSTGSRIRIYSWNSRVMTSEIPADVTEAASLKVEPGIASYVTDPAGLEEHLGSMIAKAKKEVPSTLHKTTPLYVMATAGMVSKIMF